MSDVCLQVYSRPGCHLCEDLIEELLTLVRGRARVETRNIEDNQDWQREFFLRIPVVESAGKILCEGRLDPDPILRHLEGRDAPDASR